jgi:Ca2+-binding EF-hand superfamily protein
MENLDVLGEDFDDDDKQEIKNKAIQVNSNKDGQLDFEEFARFVSELK